jgi:hypothetical protein
MSNDFSHRMEKDLHAGGGEVPLPACTLLYFERQIQSDDMVMLHFSGQISSHPMGYNKIRFN